MSKSSEKVGVGHRFQGKLFQSAKGSVIFPMFRLVWVGGGEGCRNEQGSRDVE